MIRIDIEAAEIRALARELDATPSQIGKAVTRALSRTAGTLRRMARPVLTKGLDLRRSNALRKRLKELRVGRKGYVQNSVGRTGEIQAIALWFGLNDMPASWFKGRPSQTTSGVEFRGHQFPGAFLARMKNGKVGIYKRSAKGRFPIREQTVPISDEAQTILEDEIFAHAAEIFMHHFAVDLRARVRGFGSPR
ncbi:phage tail protein [Fuscibacter oryzae]|uniref:Phage tail protein n=1 Tax=Fuscibacter oryzae TaxID=2803939 RepID=A0A8J7SWV8_9RHOB|nr:phage tail protein [Fuscibacter oryzae]MBL4929334.1 phage tail protein [Fuscibacter oryzae]